MTRDEVEQSVKLSGLVLCLLLVGCGSSDVEGPTEVVPADYTAFVSPELVVVQGYDGHVMEPFFTRDGKYLFFNDLGPEDKDIYFASYDQQSDSFIYQAAIVTLNTPAVEGVPTLDDNNRFYYVSTFNYPPDNANIFDTIYVGDFHPALMVLPDPGQTRAGPAPWVAQKRFICY